MQTPTDSTKAPGRPMYCQPLSDEDARRLAAMTPEEKRAFVKHMTTHINCYAISTHEKLVLVMKNLLPVVKKVGVALKIETTWDPTGKGTLDIFIPEAYGGIHPKRANGMRNYVIGFDAETNDCVFVQEIIPGGAVMRATLTIKRVTN